MEVEVKNPANNPMHYGDQPVVGVIQAPDHLPNRILYSGIEGRREFEKIDCDMYESVRKAKKIERHKFPTVMKWVLGAMALVGVAIFGKSAFKHLKGLFKRNKV